MKPAKTPTTESTSLDLEVLVRRHQVGLWRYLRALGCEASIAEDLVQDTFVTVLRTDVVDHGDAAIGAFLRTVARNLFISRQRREKRMQSVAEIEEIDLRWMDWVQDDSGNELLDQLRSCFERLTARAQRALRMRFREKKARTEIADDLGLTEHGAKNLMQRAKHQLRRCIEDKNS